MDKMETRNLNLRGKPYLTETSSPRSTLLSGTFSMIANVTGLHDLGKARKAYQEKNYRGTARHIVLSAARLTVLAVAALATLQVWKLQKENDLLNTKTVQLDKKAKGLTVRIDALNQKIDQEKNTIACLQTERRKAQRLLHNCRSNREYYLNSHCEFVAGNSFPPPVLFSNTTECLDHHHEQIERSEGPCGGWIAEIPPLPDACGLNGYVI